MPIPTRNTVQAQRINHLVLSARSARLVAPRLKLYRCIKQDQREIIFYHYAARQYIMPMAIWRRVSCDVDADALHILKILPQVMQYSW